VDYIPDMVTPHRLVQAIELSGYKTYEPQAAGDASAEDPERGERLKEYHNLRNRFIFAAILAALILLLTFGEYIPVLKSIPTQVNWIILFVLTTPVLFWAGSRFYIGAWSATHHRTADMNTLIALGTGAAYLYSVVATFVPSVLPQNLRSVYYDTTSIIIA
jgi:Cu+-exporting ATPase